MTTPLIGPTLFGDVRECEPANVVNLLNVTPFALALERELAKSAAILADPFKHLPAALMPPTWARIVAATSKNLRGHFHRPTTAETRKTRPCCPTCGQTVTP